ncbi:MAG: flagellar hook protein FlgE [Bryocella sp.]
MGSFSIALTGLKANSTALNTIGNNLANMNTTAFKDQTTTFSDLFYQQVGSSGSGNALEQGLGTRVSSTSSDFTQGTLSTTDNSTDMAIEGNGFFVTTLNGSEQLTRAGNFQIDNQGNLITTSGANVMGYAAVNGAVAAGGSLAPLRLPIGESQAAQATSNFSLTGNLSSGAAIGAAFSTPVTMYDSLGTSHMATVNFTKTASDTWDYSVALPVGDETGTPMNNTGTLSFDSSGKLVSPTANVSGINFPGMADGAGDLSLSWGLYDGSGNGLLSQTSGATASSETTQNGFPSGTYNNFTVDANGAISASFSNGQTQVVGQVALANVANEQGLVHVGNNAYVATQASGAMTIGKAGAGGLGSIEDQAVESSNVDISTEFTNLIVAQRAFEANSKTVTTFDTLTQETINMIHA